MFQKLYRLCLAPIARTEDDRRRESILDILLLGSVSLSLVAVVVAIINSIAEGRVYSGIPPQLMSVIAAIFIGLFVLSRRGWYRPAAYVFVAIFWLFATYPLVVWGILLPQGILAYAVVIVMAGILLNSRVAFVATSLMVATLFLLTHLQAVGVLDVDMRWSRFPGNYSDALIFGLTFLLMAIVSWLSNREIQASLIRARRSEQELRKERNSLEVKVQERTKELQQSQIERVLQLQRFAEFGRLTSTLLHDLTNPLTSVSLELEQLADTEQAELVREARHGVAAMERYVLAARRQLRNQSELKLFDVAEEVKHAINFLDSKAKNVQVALETKLTPGLKLYGDSIRFNQIVTNLIANAIDAYETVEDQRQRRVIIDSKTSKGWLVITVQDFALGISKSDLKHIFDAFFTTKASERGSGLGLSIAKRSAEEDFGGSIGVTSTKGRGTCFTVELPLS